MDRDRVPFRCMFCALRACKIVMVSSLGLVTQLCSQPGDPSLLTLLLILYSQQDT